MPPEDRGYFDIDAEVVWRTVTSELPTLIPRIQRALDTERSM
jgi:uncharacterized protein with HEPN domain